MGRKYRIFSVTAAVVFALFWAGAALAQDCPANSGGLMLTAAGQAAGFGLSTLACDFPSETSSDNGNIGPMGSITVSGSDSILVTDFANSTVYEFSDQGVPTNGWDVQNGSQAQSIAECTGGCSSSIDFLAITNAFEPGGPIPSGYTTAFSVDVLASTTFANGNTVTGALDTLTYDPSGNGGQGSLSISSTSFGFLCQGVGLAVTSSCGVEQVAPGDDNGDGLAEVPSTATNVTVASNANPYDTGLLPGDLLVLAADGIWAYNEAGESSLIVPDDSGISDSPCLSDPSLVGACDTGFDGDGLAVSADGSVVYVESGDDSIIGFSTDGTGTIDFSTGGDDFLCSDGTECLTNADGLSVIQSGDLEGDLLLNTNDGDVDVVCTTTNAAAGCIEGEVVPIATGGSRGDFIGLDENTGDFLVSQSTTLDDLSYGGGALPAAVPEPASLALLGAGLIGLGVIRRRREA